VRLIGLIPARGGSKGIPRKNLALCGGLPLIVHTCRASTDAASLNGVYLSTDDAEIAAAVKDTGVVVPFLRLAELATDTTTSLAVLQHFVEWLDANDQAADAVVLLQPTSPLRTSRHIDEAVEIFKASGCDSLVSLMRIDHRFMPAAAMRIVDGRAVSIEGTLPTVHPRQDYETLYARNGPAILISRVATLRSGSLYGRTIAPYVMLKLASIDIDDADDLAIADALMRTRGANAASEGS
jgi:CMP-N,N'-diacetyllegionaminic acid synthase